MTDKFIDHITRYDTDKVLYKMLYDKVFPKFRKLLLLGLLTLPGDTSIVLQNNQEPIGNERSINENEKDLSNHPDIVINGQTIPYNWRGEPMDSDSTMTIDEL